MGQPLPTTDVGYPVAQLGSQLSGGEIARPTDAGRPKPDCRVAPKQPDGEPSQFMFRFYEAAVRDLKHPAGSGCRGYRPQAVFRCPRRLKLRIRLNALILPANPIWAFSARGYALDVNKHFESRPHDVPDELPSDFVRDAG